MYSFFVINLLKQYSVIRRKKPLRTLNFEINFIKFQSKKCVYPTHGCSYFTFFCILIF